MSEHGGIGQPVVREGADAKVTGRARYTADLVFDGLLYAVLVTSTVARGRILEVDTGRADSIPGLRLVMTHHSLNEELSGGMFLGRGGHFQSSVNPLGSAAVLHFGQIVALVVAVSAEAAEQAAARLAFRYESEPASATMHAGLGHATAIPALSIDKGAGHSLPEPAAVIDATYTTPAQHQNPIEPYVTTARWSQDALEVWLPSQWVAGTRMGLARVLGIAPEQVRIISRNVGGGFGAKASVFWHTALVAVAARRLQAPVRLVVSRTQMFTVGSFRPASRHHVRLEADAEGRLQRYEHEAWGQTSRMDTLVLPGTDYSARIYAAPVIRTREHAVASDVNTPGFMRAPLEVPSNFALECAMDELAIGLGIDPVRLRLINDTANDPVSGLPFSSRGLAQCLRRGAEVFGWEGRDARVGAMRGRDGERIGWGCASAWYPVYRAPASARACLGADGRATISISAHELGQGASTALKQIAADTLGLPASQVSVALGDSDLPVGPMAGGSNTTASAGSAVHAACLLLLQKRRSRRGVAGEAVEAVATWAPDGMAPATIRAAMTGARLKAGPIGDTHAMFGFGAHFVEVMVNPRLGSLRLGRMVGVFDCGRIVNPRTARSNLAGGMIWGASHALMEETVVDEARARFVNTDLGSYHFACHSDIGEVTIEMVELVDELVNPLGVKSVGEIGVVGIGAAIANAVRHATGIRVRKMPILLDDLLSTAAFG